MGRSTTPTFAVTAMYYHANGGRWGSTPYGWDSKREGRPSDATLARHVAAFEASTRQGGANAHLGAATVLRARVVRQSTGETVGVYAPVNLQDPRAVAAFLGTPAFEVVA